MGTSAKAVHARTLVAAGVAAVLLVPCIAAARPTVVVADFSDSTNAKGRADRVRGAIVKAIQEAGQLELVPFAKVKTLAATRKLKPATLANPKVLQGLIKDVGAQAVVTGEIYKASQYIILNIRVFDAVEAKPWEKKVKLDSGELTASLAQKFAAATSTFMGGKAEKAVPEPKVPVRETVVDEPPPKVNPNPSSDDEPTGPMTPVPEPTRKPSKSTSPAAEPEPATPPTSQRDDIARPGWLELSTDFTMTWRNYQFCPEVRDCSETPPPTAGSPVKYNTDKPYGGFFFRLDAFPLRFLNTNFANGIGASFGYGRSVGLQTHYTDADRQDRVFGSTQERITVELVYRFYFRIEGVGDGWAGLRGGWAHYAFYVDDNPVIVESVRSGFFGSLELAMPVHKYLRLEVRASLIPIASPGATEQAKYGAGDDANDRPTQGGGWTIEGGLTSDFGHPEWRIGIQGMFEYMSFGDRYNNPMDVHPNFGRALESYIGFRLGLKTHL